MLIKVMIFQFIFLFYSIVPSVYLLDTFTSDTELPTLKGKLVYHSYSSYDALDSQMFLYDFSTNILENISKDWTNVVHSMNGHFSPNGRYITFMGIGKDTNSWDIFLYEIKRKGQPINLTPKGDSRDEDPKWSNSGETIVFKRNGRLAEINVNTKEIKFLSDNSEEYSMPYYSSDDKKLLFSGNAKKNAYIGLWDIANSKMTVLIDRKDICDYYPINIDNETFYFSTHYSNDNPSDQLFKGFWSGKEPISLAFNKKDADFSDAYPISNGWLFLVSTRVGGQGNYDLYIAHETSGAIYSLDLFNKNINSAKAELGPAYYVDK